MSKFLTLLAMDVRTHTKSYEGYAYLPWALALSLSGRPNHSYTTFKTHRGEMPLFELFGGGVVAVDMDIGNGKMQRIHLPVTNAKGEPIPFNQITSNDVSNTQARCLARAIAMVHGLGLSLYSLTDGDGKAYVDALAVRPDTPDLGQISELRDIKEIKDKKTSRVLRRQEYLGWHAALSACRITDPCFEWEVVECESMDPEDGCLVMLPAMRVPGKGWMVGVRVTWRNRTHTQWLPIMGVATVQTKNGPKPMEHQSIDKPTVFQWHSAVMRCLAKAIATGTGYGISCYAGDHVVPEVSTHADDVDASGQTELNHQGPSPAKQVESELNQRIEKIDTLIVNSGTDKARFIAWLGVPDLQSAEPMVLERAEQALTQRLAEQAANARH